MPKYLTQKEAFNKCKTEGKFIVTEETDKERIKSTLAIAESDIQSADYLKKNIAQKSNQWNSVYKLYYDALHELTESLLCFERIKIDNHQCLFAYLCEKYPEFNWEQAELQFILYIKKLKKEIQKKL